ncbi:MAG: glycosyltransferase [Lachnospiraceae bacterium]|nr:glycosyltransferase [Lachnospiraceae bacterium]
MDKVDIIIPAYKPGHKFLTLIEKLEHQSVPVNQIIVMNTEQKYFDRLIYGTSFQKDYRNVTVKHVSKREFDHGKTRNQGVQCSDADYFVMMTQDAVPADEYVVEELLKQLREDHVAVAYARQLANEDSSEIEKYTRNFNYPDQSVIKTKADLNKYGIKTFFCSNVCAAYNRKIFDELGGFVKHTIFNEDMLFAAKAVEAGYGIAYTAQARIFHSHDYSYREQLHRNFDLGVSQAEHPEVFAAYPSESEGIRYVRQIIRHLSEVGMKRKIPHVILQSGFKYIGYLCGKHYRCLPRRMVVAMSSAKEYWK